MRFVMIGSHFCPETLEALEAFRDRAVSYEFVDIAGQPDGLRRFMQARDGNPLFADVLGRGVGIPYFRFDDGFETLDLPQALAHAEL